LNFMLCYFYSDFYDRTASGLHVHLDTSINSLLLTSPVYLYHSRTFRTPLDLDNPQRQQTSWSIKPSSEQSGTFFAFSAGFPMPGPFDHLKDAFQHSCSSLSDLAIEIPDLLRDAFSKIRCIGNPNTAPWDMNPCCFHIHNDNVCVYVECAVTLNLNLPRDGRQTDRGRVQYFVQEMTLKRDDDM
jgi:hypothetical protein